MQIWLGCSNPYTGDPPSSGVCGHEDVTVFYGSAIVVPGPNERSAHQPDNDVNTFQTRSYEP